MAWKNYNRPNKYNNHKTIVDGIKFDSIREAERYPISSCVVTGIS